MAIEADVPAHPHEPGAHVARPVLPLSKATRAGGRAPAGAPPRIFLPEGYESIDATSNATGYPGKVIRLKDQVEFKLCSDGIYLPVDYAPVDGPELVDGWPRTIALDGASDAPRFVRIAGNHGNERWTMGAWDDDPGAERSDAPAFSVFITSGFYMRVTEVTNGELEDFYEQKRLASPSEWKDAFDDRKKLDEKSARKYPAVSISREQALRYARSVFAMLPTEAQLEYAARSGGKHHFYAWGNRPLPDRNLANINSLDQWTVPVGTFLTDVTEDGLLDMTGNVKEMCRDVWKPYQKHANLVKDPYVEVPDGPNPEFVIRGGNYGSPSYECTTTFRDGKRSETPDGFPGVGFRLVIECPDARPVKRTPDPPRSTRGRAE